MKKTSLVPTWLKQRFGKHKKNVAKAALASCMTIGLATSWCIEADADVRFKIEVTPTQTISNAFVYLGNNDTGGDYFYLGTLLADETYLAYHTLNEFVPFPHSPEYYQAGVFKNAGYFFGGTYDEMGELGMVVSFPDTGPIDLESSWDDVFVPIPGINMGTYSESQIIAATRDRNYGPDRTSDHLQDWASDYGDTIGFNGVWYEGPMVTYYGQEATLTAFSQATFSGTGMVTVVGVPEPASTGIMFGAVGLGILRRRRQHTE